MPFPLSVWACFGGNKPILEHSRAPRRVTHAHLLLSSNHSAAARGAVELCFWEMLSSKADQVLPLWLPGRCSPPPPQVPVEAGLRVVSLLLAAAWGPGELHGPEGPASHLPVQPLGAALASHRSEG